MQSFSIRGFIKVSDKVSAQFNIKKEKTIWHMVRWFSLFLFTAFTTAEKKKKIEYTIKINKVKCIDKIIK